MKNELILTIDQLREAIRGYQKRLKLMDWDIDVGLVPQRTMSDLDGKCNIIIEQKSAFISIPTPETWVGSSDCPQNMLLTICHELIHLTIPHVHQGVFASDIEYAMFEQGLDLIAQAIVSSKPFDSSGNTEGK